jgi:hypothetical protein
MFGNELTIPRYNIMQENKYFDGNTILKFSCTPRLFHNSKIKTAVHKMLKR